MVGRNSVLNISLGNWGDDRSKYLGPATDDPGRWNTAYDTNFSQSSRVSEIDGMPDVQLSEKLDFVSNRMDGGSAGKYPDSDSFAANAQESSKDGGWYGGQAVHANRGAHMEARNYTNQTPSVVVIYAKENIYIDGDVYFDYGDGVHHAPTEHTYHSKDNTFRIIKFSGQNSFDVDPDTLIRSNNTAFSESIYQFHTTDVKDVGDSSIPHDGTVSAIDFTLEAGERQGLVQHGSGGACGDVFGTDSEGRSVHGTSAIGWGCGRWRLGYRLDRWTRKYLISNAWYEKYFYK